MREGHARHLDCPLWLGIGDFVVHLKRSDHMGETEKAAQGSFPAVSSFSPESAASSGKADAP